MNRPLESFLIKRGRFWFAIFSILFLIWVSVFSNLGSSVFWFSVLILSFVYSELPKAPKEVPSTTVAGPATKIGEGIGYLLIVIVLALFFAVLAFSMLWNVADSDSSLVPVGIEIATGVVVVVVAVWKGIEKFKGN